MEGDFFFKNKNLEGDENIFLLISSKNIFLLIFNIFHPCAVLNKKNHP